MTLVRTVILIVSAVFAMAVPSVADAIACPHQNSNYSYVGGAAAVPLYPNARTDLHMKFKYLTLSDPIHDHTQGAVAVNNGWDYSPSDPSYASVEAGIGLFGHRRDIPWDRNGDGNPDPILWASHNPSGSGDDQFSFEGWADPDVIYRFEIVEVSPNNVRIWIGGVESNLTHYGDLWHQPPRYGPGARYVQRINYPYLMQVFGEDNSAGDEV
jgi:hypothetical protein